MGADLIVGHNVIKFDIPAITKVYPWFSVEREQVEDTLVLSRLLYADIQDMDYTARKIEPKLYGSHSLKAWGQRLNFPKGDYDGGWESFSDEMLRYNIQDVEVTTKLYKLLKANEGYSEQASILEHIVAWVIAQMERYGFTFNRDKAFALAGELMARRNELQDQLQETFPPWDEPLGMFTPKVNNKTRGYVKGVPVMRYKRMEFNPSSRHHIANRLKALRGWKPKAVTPDGKPKVDEKILASLIWPEAKLLSKYFLVEKRIGMLAEGKGAWLKAEVGGRIHGECITNGAVTGRATHRSPNIAQVPSVEVSKDHGVLTGESGGWGYECRSLFGPSRGRVQVGIDVSGLELRMLAHFMHRYDNGAYAYEVVTGDVHTANQKAAGLDTRSQAKTFIYAFLYGAGPEKIGSIAGKGANHGRLLRKRFLQRTPALAKLLKAIKKASSRGYLIGLDGRRLAVRSPHSAPNTLLQSAGALVCKQWIVELDKAIMDDPRLLGRVQLLAWVHDELQFEADPDVADDLGRLAVACIERAGDHFGIRVPLTGEYKIGNNWAKTH